MSTHNLCFRAKISKNVYLCTSQFYFTKVGCKGVFVTRTCFRDVCVISELEYRGMICAACTTTMSFLHSMLSDRAVQVLGRCMLKHFNKFDPQFMYSLIESSNLSRFKFPF